MHIPKIRIGAGKVLANALMPDFSATSDIILGYALSMGKASVGVFAKMGLVIQAAREKGRGL
jgi:hypothetical protein